MVGRQRCFREYRPISARCPRGHSVFSGEPHRREVGHQRNSDNGGASWGGSLRRAVSRKQIRQQGQLMHGHFLLNLSPSSVSTLGLSPCHFTEKGGGSWASKNKNGFFRDDEQTPQ